MQRGKSKCNSSRSPDRNPAMPSVPSSSLLRPSSHAQSGKVERSNPFAFRSLNGLLGAENRKPKKGFSSSYSKRRDGSRTPNKNSNRYLKPGALVQVRDARMNIRASSSYTAIGRKRVLVMDYGDKGNHGGRADGASTGPLLALSNDSKNHDLSPQKKILLTPKTPSTPVTPKTNSVPILFEEEAQDSEVKFRLESLPFDLLIRILCLLHHDQLKAVFHVSERLRKVAIVARQCYFNYTTPDRSRQEMLKLITPRPDRHWPFVEKEFGNGPIVRCPIPRDSRPGKPAREGIKNRRMAREKRCVQVPLLHQRAPYVDAYALQASDPYASVYQRHALPPADPLPVRNALQASDPYASVYQRQGLLPADPLPVRNALQTSDPYASIYQRQALPPADPLPMRNGLVSDFDYRGVDPELEYLHRQRIRERMLE